MLFLTLTQSSESFIHWRIDVDYRLVGASRIEQRPMCSGSWHAIFRKSSTKLSIRRPPQAVHCTQCAALGSVPLTTRHSAGRKIGKN